MNCKFSTSLGNIIRLNVIGICLADCTAVLSLRPSCIGGLHWGLTQPAHTVRELGSSKGC